MGGNVLVQSLDGLPQPTDKNHIAVGFSFRVRLTGDDLLAGGYGVTEIVEPRQGGFFAKLPSLIVVIQLLLVHRDSVHVRVIKAMNVRFVLF